MLKTNGKPWFGFEIRNVDFMFFTSIKRNFKEKQNNNNGNFTLTRIYRMVTWKTKGNDDRRAMSDNME